MRFGAGNRKKAPSDRGFFIGLDAEPEESRLRGQGYHTIRKGMAKPGLFMNLSSRRERSFFLAQAFTPGNRESNGFFQPPSGGLCSDERRSPLEGGYPACRPHPTQA